MDGGEAIIWEHGRRNFALDVDETRTVMEADPGVQASVFIVEAHACRSFPGDALP